jgi:membrane-bound ClpP family serine protease
MGHVVQIGGALLVLGAFALAQARVLTPQARAYLILNVVGAAILAVDAYVERQWGFLLLEGVWAIITAWGLARPPRVIAEPS